MNRTPSEHDIHAYIDGRLDAAQRAEVEARLAADPALARQVAQWQRDARALRSALAGEELRPNPALDPQQIRQRLQRRRLGRLALAASFLLSLGLGGVGGWQMRDMSLAGSELPMGDALQAYRMLVMDGSLQPDMVQQQPGELQRWLGAHFSNAARMPDLDDAGFQAVSARMMSTSQGPAAMVVYRDPQGRSITFYIRPPGPARQMLPKGERRDGQLMARYWSGQGYNYALVGSADAEMERTLKAVTEG